MFIEDKYFSTLDRPSKFLSWTPVMLYWLNCSSTQLISKAKEGLYYGVRLALFLLWFCRDQNQLKDSYCRKKTGASVQLCSFSIQNWEYFVFFRDYFHHGRWSFCLKVDLCYSSVLLKASLETIQTCWILLLQCLYLCCTF